MPTSQSHLYATIESATFVQILIINTLTSQCKSMFRNLDSLNNPQHFYFVFVFVTTVHVCMKITKTSSLNVLPFHIPRLQTDSKARSDKGDEDLRSKIQHLIQGLIINI